MSLENEIMHFEELKLIIEQTNKHININMTH